MDPSFMSLDNEPAVAAVATPIASAERGKDAAKDITYGSIAGTAGKFIEYPFDTVKVRLQSQSYHLPLEYDGPLDCFKQSLRRDGFLGLYRGISAPMVGAAVETSSLFFSYRLAQDVLQSTMYLSQPLGMGALLFCGAISGAFTSLLLTPIELVKCKMQVPVDPALSSRPRLGPLGHIISIYRHQGLPGFWHGQMGTLIRETGGSAAWFGSYEGVGLLFRRMKNLSPDATLPIWQQMAAGATAGMSYNFMFYPADTIKSRMQTEDVSQMAGRSQSFWGVTKTLWQQQGLKGLYRGCGITVARSAPSSAIIFTIFETLKARF